MDLKHLSYISRLAEPTGLGDLIAAIGKFRDNNIALGITGCIAFEGEKIMQVLQGPSIAVDELFAAIKGDPRHRDVIELDCRSVEQVSFQHWGMLRLPIVDVVFLSQLS